MSLPLRLAALSLLTTGLVAVAPPPAAQAAITTAFDGALTCTTGTGGVRECAGVVDVPDDQATPLDPGTVPIDVNLSFPPAPTGAPDGPWPLVGEFHGWGGSKIGRSSANRFLNQGYAYFSISDRGWGLSCGGQDPKRLDPTSGCRNGYNHLMDTRFEVTDVQHLLGLLVDDGLVDPGAIGVTGGSYGGGLSMALAALNTRTMPADYEQGDDLEPWTSPDGTPLGIAAAAPDIPWTDLAYSLVPNGRTLDYVADAPYLGPDGDFPIGVMKQSFDSGLYGIGLALSNYAPTGTDPDADLNRWYALLTAGEPYDANPMAADIIEEFTTHHSSYYIDDSVEPAPLHISNGFTDDLFPVDEAVRFYNKTITQHPDAKLYLYFSDHGHQRGQNKGDDAAKRRASVDAWFAHFLKGEGPEPANGVSVLTQTCGAPSEGPFSADSWAGLPQSEIVLKGGDTAALISPQAGDPTTNQAYDPIAGGGACATAAGDDQPGLASYRVPAAPAGGYTLVGSPTIVADVLNVSPNSQLAYRLVDVDPDTGDGTLVARGLYRPGMTSDGSAERVVFQMHPNAYVFEEGHVAKLELMPNDTPYSRISNGQGVITVANLELRLPILEAPGTAGSAEPLPLVVPEGYELAPDFAEEPVDTDGDGIPDGEDDCVNDAGPASEVPGENGCPLPPADSDGDGVPDENDACPDDFGPADNGGCPVTDGDGDGIPDDEDDCPTEAGPASEVPGENGCPVPPVDSDGDGIPDGEDACPNDAGPASTGGCPDRDGDGVVDSQDQCPDDAGPAENNGCPETVDEPDPDPETDPEPNGNSGDETCGDNRVTGDGNANRLRGTRAPERMRGNGGNDRIFGRGGDDCLFGNRGRDIVRGDGGDDVVVGNGGSDGLFGGSGADQLRGGANPDFLRGGSGADFLRGGKGGDLIIGGPGRDRIFGGAGNDRINTKDGRRDLVQCGSGVDRVFADPEDVLRGCERVRRR